jgi:hypothetical protein
MFRAVHWQTHIYGVRSMCRACVMFVHFNDTAVCDSWLPFTGGEHDSFMAC